ncbi:MAG: DUF3786 domain-containing protein [Coriobacteriales bacterium]|jgi:hypothetical protein|nr:DUF3786 domain-containing protein [Coriobacteriales bacterium]
MAEIKGGYEKTYDVLVPRLAGCDFASVCGDLGLEPPQDGVVRIEFLRRPYEIDATGVRCLTESTRKYVNRKSVLIYYLTSGGRGEPLMQFQMLHAFSQGIFSGSRGTEWMTSGVCKLFGDSPELFSKTMDVLGARRLEPRPSAHDIWEYWVLPRVPTEISYYGADEEFPCEIRVMFDKTALAYVPFETLAVLDGCLIQEINDIGIELTQ